MLEDENRRLKLMVADLSLDNRALEDVLGRKWGFGGILWAAEPCTFREARRLESRGQAEA